MKEDDNIFDELIAKSLAGETTSIEEQQLAEWVEAAPENKETFEKTCKVFDLSNTAYANKFDSKLIDVDSEWQQFVSTVENEKSKVVVMNTRTTSRWLKIAASILIIASSAFILNYFITRNSLIEYQTAEMTQEITLPDQSIVTLNRNSSLSYSKDFGKVNRTVSLTGEAFFDVTPNKNSTFIINAANSQIQVLGTSFNVQTDGETTEVVVATGVVKFSNKITRKGIILKAGNKGQLKSVTNDLKVTENADTNFNAWKTHKIIFDEDNLSTVLSTLKKVYAKDIILDVATPQSCEVTVTFDQQSLDAVLNVLKSTLNLTYSIEGDKIIITDTGC